MLTQQVLIKQLRGMGGKRHTILSFEDLNVVQGKQTCGYEWKYASVAEEAITSDWGKYGENGRKPDGKKA